MNTAAIVEAATEYARRGFSVIPLGKKRTPTCALRPAFKTAAKPEDVPGWFARQRGLAGVGIVVGEVSGGLYARDFDDAALYERWKAANPELAATLPTVKTNTGFHVYARWPGFKTRYVESGEVRINLVYVAAPPSRHEAGTFYEWLVPFPAGDVPILDPSTFGLGGDKKAKGSACKGIEVSDAGLLGECAREPESQRSRVSENQRTGEAEN